MDWRYKTHMNSIRKILGLSNSIFRTGLVYATLAMLVAYPGLSSDSCPLETKPQKSACGCGCDCGTANAAKLMPEGDSSGCPCGMADRRVIPSAPLNAMAPISPQNLPVPGVALPVALETDMGTTGYTAQNLKPVQSSLPLYIRHASLLI